MTKTIDPTHAPNGLERRFHTAHAPRLQKRAEGEGETIVGYGAVFYREGEAGTEFWLYDDLVERIRPGAFDAAIRDQDDAIGTFNHDLDQILGRVSNATVRLSVDAVGLRYEIDPPNTTDAKDLLERLRRGDVKGSSFGFYAGYGGKRGKVSWTDETRDGKQVTIRWIEDLELVDVGPVVRPAYEGTSTGLRGLGDESEAARIKAERDAWRASRSSDDETTSGKRKREQDDSPKRPQEDDDFLLLVEMEAAELGI